MFTYCIGVELSERHVCDDVVVWLEGRNSRSDLEFFKSKWWVALVLETIGPSMVGLEIAPLDHVKYSSSGSKSTGASFSSKSSQQSIANTTTPR